MIVLTNKRQEKYTSVSLPPSVGARFMIGRMRWSPMSDNVLWLVAAAEIGLVVTFLVLVLVLMPS